MPVPETTLPWLITERRGASHADDLHRLGERRRRRTAGCARQSNADALADVRDHRDAVGIEHPIGLALPIHQHMPGLLRPWPAARSIVRPRTRRSVSQGGHAQPPRTMQLRCARWVSANTMTGRGAPWRRRWRRRAGPPRLEPSASPPRSTADAGIAWDDDGTIVYAGPAGGLPWAATVGDASTGAASCPGSSTATRTCRSSAGGPTSSRRGFAASTYRGPARGGGGIFRSARQFAAGERRRGARVLRPLLAEMLRTARPRWS